MTVRSRVMTVRMGGHAMRTEQAATVPMAGVESFATRVSDVGAELHVLNLGMGMGRLFFLWDELEC